MRPNTLSPRVNGSTRTPKIEEIKSNTEMNFCTSYYNYVMLGISVFNMNMKIFLL